MGLRASPTVQLNFDGMRVPAANLLGEEGQGFIYAMRSLDHGRLGIAAQALGIARAALEHALDYTAQRQQFGAADPRLPGDPVQARRHGRTHRVVARAPARHGRARRTAANRRRCTAR